MSPEEQVKLEERLGKAQKLDRRINSAKLDLQKLEAYYVHVYFESRSAVGHSSGEGWMEFRELDDEIKAAVTNLVQERILELEEEKRLL